MRKSPNTFSMPWHLTYDKKEKENRQPKGGMGGRHAATNTRDFKERSVVLAVEEIRSSRDPRDHVEDG